MPEEALVTIASRGWQAKPLALVCLCHVERPF